ncbi:MAG: hypothetical protein HY692_00515, partial [Cyanobacteria bacterium NC_groundwater_1444_Ag_S-0.65um_54_12]|nr:hypothetical protein [Cyanobacteria bacterium NC_groundwater_1444_Ag_S-0.65um_54_12]
MVANALGALIPVYNSEVLPAVSSATLAPPPDPVGISVDAAKDFGKYDKDKNG